MTLRIEQGKGRKDRYAMLSPVLLERLRVWWRVARAQGTMLDGGYRATGRTRHKTMTLGADEFMRRFLLHVLPGGFDRIRHYGLLANAGRRENLATARELLGVATKSETPGSTDVQASHVQPTFVCRCCGAAMVVVEILARRPSIRAPPPRSDCP
jgi:integrase